MRCRPSIRATAAAVFLLLATTASGTVNAASASLDPANRTASAESSRPVVKAKRNALRTQPVGHGNMAHAGTRRTSGPIPRPMNPLTKGTSRGTSPAPGAGPAVATAATPPGQATLTASEPNIQKTSFDGLSRSGGPDTNGEPPDPWVAVGPDHVMQVTNSSFRTTTGRVSRRRRRRSPPSSTRSGSPS